MNISRLTFIAALFLSFSSVNTYARNKIKVIDKGMDGDVRNYSVGCPNGENSSIEFYFGSTKTATSKRGSTSVTGNGKSSTTKIGKVCIYPTSGEKKCKASWSIQDAARESCS